MIIRNELATHVSVSVLAVIKNELLESAIPFRKIIFNVILDYF